MDGARRIALMDVASMTSSRSGGDVVVDVRLSSGELRSYRSPDVRLERLLPGLLTQS